MVYTGDKKREYDREWHRRKRIGLETTGINPRKIVSDSELLANRKNSQKQWLSKLHELLDNEIGDKCFICGKKKSLICHKKDGTEHKTFIRMGLKELTRYLLQNKTDFVRLCYGCHKGVHWSMKWFDMSWEEIIERLKYLKKI